MVEQTRPWDQMDQKDSDRIQISSGKLAELVRAGADTQSLLDAGTELLDAINGVLNTRGHSIDFLVDYRVRKHRRQREQKENG